MKKTFKIIIGFIIGIGIIFLSKEVYGASATITSSSNNITTEQTATITVNVQQTETWHLMLSSNGGELTGQTNEADAYGEEKNATALTAYFKATSPGTYTISLSGQIAGSDLKTENISGVSTIITVTSPYTPPPSTDPEPPVVSEPNFTSVNQTVYATTEVNVRSSYSTSSGSIGSLQEGDSVTRTGIGDNGWSRVSYNGSTGYIFSQYLTTTAPTVDNEDDNEEDNPVKSSNNYLKSLTVNNGTLSPNFNPRTTSYTVVVEDDLEEITISAEPEDEKATVSGTGTIQLEEGNTTARIEVVAENGSTNTYTIHIRKESAEEIIPVGIKSLKIQGVTVDNKTENISFMPDFKTEVTEYTCNVSDQITKLLITAEPNEEGMTIEILGNENLQMGENVITILVKSEDGQEIYTYQIIVTKGEVAPTSRYGFI